MKYDIKILKTSDAKYIFKVNQFDSRKYFWISPMLSPVYSSAWRAYRDATKLVAKGRSHLFVLAGGEDDEHEPVRSNVSAEEELIDHYYELVSIMAKQSQGKEIGEKAEIHREMIYEEIKGIVGELLMVKDQID